MKETCENGAGDRGASRLENAEHVSLANNEAIFPVDLHFAAVVFAEEDAVADLHVEGAHRPVLENFTVADGHHFAFGRLFLGGIRDDYPAFALLFLFYASNDETIVKGANLRHVRVSSWCMRVTPEPSILPNAIVRAAT